MDHLAPSSGVNWYNSYNAFGELLPPTPQLSPMELGGMDVGRPYNPPGQVHYHPSEGEGLHYGQEFNHPSVVASPVQSRALNKVKVAVGEKTSACQECGATFACGANLRNHMRIHTGERPFVCEECGASFTQRSNMRSHKRVHTGEKPYMCGICGQTFARSSHLPGHMRTHTGEKPFTCTYCGRSFATNQIMKNHMRTHTGERPFVCDVCDATFAQSSCLATHKKIHTGERNFKCVKCGKAFISRSGLQTHERVHTGEKPYKCEGCDKAFRTSSYLSKHRQKYCGNESFVKVSKHSDPSKTQKNSGSSRRSNKCKMNLKEVSQSLSKQTSIKKTQHLHRNASCKPDGNLECHRPIDEDVNIADKDDPDRENYPDENDHEIRLNNVTVPTTNQEILSIECNPNELVQTRPLEDVLVRDDDTDIKEESIIMESTDVQGNNYQEMEPLNQTFQDIKNSCSFTYPHVDQSQEQGSGTHHLMENYLQETNGANFKGVYREEIPSPRVMDGQQICEELPQVPQMSGITTGTSSEVPQHNAYIVKSDSAPWYSGNHI